MTLRKTCRTLIALAALGLPLAAANLVADDTPLIGRAAAADPRGCALAIEAFAIRGPAADSRPILR